MERLAPHQASFEPTRFALRPQSRTFGALVEGVDLRVPCDPHLFAELASALREWKVLFFREQHLTPDEQGVFVSLWGDLTDDQLKGGTPSPNPADNVVVFTRDANTVGLENGWHSDGTFRPMPTLGTMLQAIEVPDVGGDTVFADMAAAFDNLPEETRRFVVGRTALHDWSLGAYAAKYGAELAQLQAEVPPVRHPVVIRHPLTDRPTLFVNRMFTASIDGLSSTDSDELLDQLCRQVDLPEVQCRFRWQPGSIAFWDNVAVQHYGVNDYFPDRRVMSRATFFSREHTALAGI
jgi:taurine dioxygenase